MKAKGIIKIILDITLLALFVVLIFAYQTGLVFHEVMGLSILLFVILHIILNWKWVSRVSKDLARKTINLFRRKAESPHSASESSIEPAIESVLIPAIESVLMPTIESSTEPSTEPTAKPQIEPTLDSEQISVEIPRRKVLRRKRINAKVKAFFMYLLDIGVLLGAAQITVTGIMISQVLFPIEQFNEQLFQLHRWTAYITIGFLGVHLLIHWRYIGAMFKAIITKLRNPVVSRTINESFAVLLVLALVCTGFISNIQHTYDNRFFAQFEDEFGEEFAGLSFEEKERIWEEEKQKYLIMVEEKKKSNSEAIDALKVAEVVPSLDGFLSGMFCTQCPRFCPLNALTCSYGRSAGTEGERVYEQIVDSRI